MELAVDQCVCVVRGRRGLRGAVFKAAKDALALGKKMTLHYCYCHCMQIADAGCCNCNKTVRSQVVVFVCNLALIIPQGLNFTVTRQTKCLPSLLFQMMRAQ